MSTCTQSMFKFLAGFAANEMLGHWMLGIWGRHLFPMKFWGITFTQEFNWLAMGLWPTALALFVFLGWRRLGTDAPNKMPSPGSPAASRA